jgi:hypothetical protein
MAPEAHDVGLPDGFRVEEGTAGLRILWHPPRFIGVGVAVFSIFWDFMLYSMLRQFTSGGAPRWFLLFMGLHLAAGVILPYVALVFLLNTSVLEVGRGTLRVKQHPLPWIGNRRLRTTDIAQLFATRVETSRRRVSYRVMARLTSGREVALVKHLWDDRQARFLEQTIEKRLGLPDVRVAGELPR